MCHECGDEEEEFNINQIPELEREEFLDYACLQVSTIMNKAENEGFLYELITEWPREKQLAFSVATVIQNRLDSVWRDEERE